MGSGCNERWDVRQKIKYSIGLKLLYVFLYVDIYHLCISFYRGLNRHRETAVGSKLEFNSLGHLGKTEPSPRQVNDDDDEDDDLCMKVALIYSGPLNFTSENVKSRIFIQF